MTRRPEEHGARDDGERLSSPDREARPRPEATPEARPERSERREAEFAAPAGWPRGLPPRAAAFSGVAAWCFLVMLIALNLAASPAHWVAVAAFGFVLPVVLVAQAERAVRAHESRPTPDEGDGERELLDALAERGELTPTAAAMRTSLTVDGASRMLERLAKRGHSRDTCKIAPLLSINNYLMLTVSPTARAFWRLVAPARSPGL